MSEDKRIARAEALLNDPLNQEFFEKTRESILRRLEMADPQDTKALQSLCMEAIWRSRFLGFYQSFLNKGKVIEFQQQDKFADRILERFAPMFRKGRKVDV